MGQKMLLSKSENHIEVVDLLEQSMALVPGFQYAYAFYHNPITKEIGAEQALGDSIITINTKSEQLSASINTLRKSKEIIEWVDKNEIPFAKHNNKLEIQKKVFDEYNHHILLYRIKSDFDNKYDLLYIFFKADSSNFGIKNSNSGLSTDQKSIISTLVSKSFSIFIKQRKESLLKQELLRGDLTRLQGFIKKSETNTQLSKYKETVYNYIYSIFDKQLQNLNLLLNIDKNTTDLIKGYTGNLSEIESKVQQCISMAYRTQNPMPGSILLIDEFIFQSYFINTTNKQSNIQLSSLDSRKQKAIHFLNNIEKAARILQSKGEKITGSNVGQSMENPISAPAISDYIKKYQKSIKTLCIENPDQWLLSKKSFNPLMNILSA